MVSLNRRTFSMAITAWSAKVVASAICCSVKGRATVRVRTRTPIGSAFAEHRNADHGAISKHGQDTRCVVFRIGHCVADVDRSSLKQSATDAGSSSGLVDNLLERRAVFRGLPEHCGDLESVAVGTPNVRPLCVAQLAGRFCQRIKHLLQIERRPADDLEHVGRGRLLLKRLRQLARARLDFVEQPHVLDGDHRLVGEGLEQRDLLRP